LVSTFAPPIVALVNVVADEPAAGLDAPAAGGLLELAELPHAAMASTAAASAAALHILRMCRVSFAKADELSYRRSRAAGIFRSPTQDLSFTWRREVSPPPGLNRTPARPVQQADRCISLAA
jgi:hypothetical protein